MPIRTELDFSPVWIATLFRGVWRNVVHRQYEMGVLNSERALQACLVGAFSALAPEVVVLVEPQLSSRGIVPDLCIGRPDSHEVLAVVEIKYVPHHRPVWEKDLQSLTTLLASERAAHTKNCVTGLNDQAMSCTSQTLGIFAAIGQHDSAAVDPDEIKKRLEAAEDSYSDAQRATFPRLLHACGVVDANSRTRKFDMGWIVSTDDQAP